MIKRFLSVILLLVMMLGVFAVPAAAGFIASDWALPELEAAYENGLIPGSLAGKDLTQAITRAEFAAVALMLYEKLSGAIATPAHASTFMDTSDMDVLKAYNVGITDGTDAGIFSPDAQLSREQAATMLTRAVKAAFIDEWTLESDARFTLDFVQPAVFYDDAGINPWARTSVYFMASVGIITGRAGYVFDPQANTQRQEALAISVRSVVNIDGDLLSFTVTDGPPDTGDEEFNPEMRANYSAAELADIKAYCIALAQDFPTGGKEVSGDELEALLSQYRRPPGDDPVYYSKYMNTYLDNIEGNWVLPSDGGSLTIEANWSVHTTDDYWKFRYETLYVATDSDEPRTGDLICNINTEDEDFYLFYRWLKGRGEGKLTKYHKWFDIEDGDGDANDFDVLDSLLVVRPVITLYPDAVVAGQECIVYSFYYDFAYTTEVEWFSKSKGMIILTEYFFSDGDYIHAIYTFDHTLIPMDADLFDPAKQGVSLWHTQILTD